MNIKKIDYTNYMVYTETEEESLFVDAFISALRHFRKKLQGDAKIELTGCCSKCHTCDEDLSQ